MLGDRRFLSQPSEMLRAPCGIKISTTAGFTFIELCFTLLIVAIVAAFTVPAYQTFIQKAQTEIQSQQLLHAISLTRSIAMQQHATAILCKSNDGKSCSGAWQDGYIILTNDNKVFYQFQNKNDGVLHWRAFPLNQNYLQFLANGLLHAENGSFWYCTHQQENPTWAIVINQSGRARLVYPNQAGKIIDDKGLPLMC